MKELRLSQLLHIALYKIYPQAEMEARLPEGIFVRLPRGIERGTGT